MSCSGGQQGKRLSKKLGDSAVVIGSGGGEGVGTKVINL